MLENVIYVLAIVTMLVIIVTKLYGMCSSIGYKKDRKIRQEERMERELNYVERDLKKKLNELEKKFDKYDDLM